ncbi:MAG: chemotaxis protein CheB [Hyphomicrobiaceae bacterium]|nr:chemotaxis protein CheB [Hyphomicrobiaceae bacterium]
MGASAGGLAAFKAFLDAMPPDSGIACILVQHLDPDHPSLLVELLAAHSRIPVVTAEDGITAAADHVYVIPPNATLTIKGGILHVDKPAPPRESRRPIDTFFRSLADDKGDCAASIVLAGVGSDGTQGLRAIKAAGGLTMAQAEHDETALAGMPMSAVATGLVDHVITADAMPAKLIEHLQTLQATAGWRKTHGSAETWPKYLNEIAAILRSAIGHDFTDYKHSTLIRRVQRRMQALGIDDVAAYIAALRAGAQEPDLLFRDLLIGVTQFFRDPEAFAALAGTVVPPLLADRDPDTPIRVWVAGCASGEEVYSIAILLQEAIDELKSAVKLQVFGTDLDPNAIAVARTARYREPMPGLSPDRLARWFVRDGDHFCPVKRIRDVCVFSVHSLVKDPPFSKLDIISCRNVMIYLNSELQHRVIQTFHYALKPGAYLFLGPSDRATRDRALFHVVDRKYRILQRRDDIQPTLPGFRPIDTSTFGRSTDIKPPTGTSENIDRSIRSAMERLSPAMLVINRHQEIIRFSGADVGQYLEPSSGEASLNLFAMLRRPLRPLVRESLQKALAGHQPVVATDVYIGEQRNPVTLIVEPIDNGMVILAFRETAPAGSDVAPAKEDASQEPGLERELATTRAQLKAALSDLETHIEEFRSSTEETQSVNEELETAKEEMQSVNEELQTVNSELHGKNEQLGRLNDDLQNLLDSTRIATLFLDKELLVRSFTPAMTNIFHLRDGDRGRPITEIVSRLAYEHLERDVAQVQRSLQMVEQEVHPKGNGATYLMRIRPYRTHDDRLDGVVLTFVDVTAMKQAEKARQTVEASFQLAQETAGIGSWRWDLSTDVLHCTPENVSLMGYEVKDGRPSYERFRARVHPDDLQVIDTRISQCRETGGDWDLEYRVVRKDGTRWILGRGHAVCDAGGHPVELIGVNLDITARKEHEQHVQFLMRELDHRTMNILTVAAALVSQGGHKEDSVEAFAARCTERIHALSRAQRLLSTANWAGADLASIVEATLAPISSEGRLVIEGPAIGLKPEAAEAISLALNELGTT